MFTLKSLPYEKNALLPYMSDKTLDFHHGKHHQAYVDKLNSLIENTDLEGLTLEEIIIKSYNNKDHQSIFNNAGQVYNHDIFWQSLSHKDEDRKITDKLMMMINNDFGSLDNFYKKFKEAAMSQFGSGWAWLVQKNNNLEIMTTSNALNPLPLNLQPLLALDVWEHSYYLDYQNKRAEFVDNFLKNLINWNFVASNLK